MSLESHVLTDAAAIPCAAEQEAALSQKDLLQPCSICSCAE